MRFKPRSYSFKCPTLTTEPRCRPKCNILYGGIIVTGKCIASFLLVEWVPIQGQRKLEIPGRAILIGFTLLYCIGIYVVENVHLKKLVEGPSLPSRFLPPLPSTV